MSSRSRVFSFVVLCMFCARCDRALAAAPGRYAAQLAREADALIRDAIRRPYGWAWESNAAANAVAEPKAHLTPCVVSMDAPGTPAAGLILLWTGKLLNDPHYLIAADQAARGIGASQMPVGRIRAHPVFGPTAGGREELFPVADRTATRCALGLLLAEIDSPQSATEPADLGIDPHTESLRATARRCAHWLAKQESPNGLWPSTYSSGTDPPEYPPEGIRLVRLDDRDYRDSTFALLLGFNVLHDDTLRHLSTIPLDGLLRMRLINDVHGPGLWCTACTSTGTDIPSGFPNGPDVLASRYAMQTLLGGYLFTGDRTLAIALEDAAKTLEQAKRADGLYDRFLDPTAAADVARSIGDDVPTTQQFFSHPATKPQINHSVLADPITHGSFGIEELLVASAGLKSTGPEAFAASMARGFSLHEQIEASLCGLIDDPLTMDFPATSQEIPAYLSAHADLWKLADGPPPSNLAGRIQRLWALLLRAKIEQIIS